VQDPNESKQIFFFKEETFGKLPFKKIGYFNFFF